MTSKNQNNYVLGFLFRSNHSQVALIKKRKPEWQRNKLNGIGGKIEQGEEPTQAMRREFLEETGADVEKWRPYAIIRWRGGLIHCFVSHGDFSVTSATVEEVRWYDVSEIPTLPTIPKLRWLVPLALDEIVTSMIDDRS